MKIEFEKIEKILACPRCKFSLIIHNLNVSCSNPKCYFNTNHFLLNDKIPILIDFSQSIVDRKKLIESNASSIIQRESKKSVKAKIKILLFGENKITTQNEKKFIKYIKQREMKPICLIIGGGSIGTGMKALYTDKCIDIIGFDIYKSPFITYFADAHNIPLQDESVNGVWIQAVLEHVLDPWRVVSEINRVLKIGGIVYAETPFMQQVHEEAYDFTRFTHSGHRWLFRSFEELSSGITAGAGTQLLWTIDYFFRSLFRSYKIGKLIKALFSPIRFLDHICHPAFSIDTASGFFFLGKKTSNHLTESNLENYYKSYRSRK